MMKIVKGGIVVGQIIEPANHGNSSPFTWVGVRETL